MKILLVGGGITSALTGMCLRKLLPDCNISLWDKARGAGGRMATTRCSLNPSCTADLGAQYITTTEEYMKANGDVYNHLISEGILEPLKCHVIGMRHQDNTKNFVVPNGTSFLVKNILQQAKINETKFSHHVSSIDLEDGRWIVETKTGEKDYFDVVVLTMPVPQLFLLEGSVKRSIQSLAEPLNTVTYSARYVLVLFYLENINENWGAQYIDNNPIFRYVSIDNIRRNQPENLCAVVLHSTVSFGAKHIEDSIPDMEKVLVSQAKVLFPNWPEPKAVKCHKWRYSQVTNTYPDAPGCVLVSSSAPLVIGGDAFAGSKFDNCIQSSKSICQKVVEALEVGKLSKKNK
ncbi:renalase-like [Macrosteles quadrilineatus]|uniref:renalase-like n=1 Tax=Macrosteles quadrilineatus TaxID=74068 RepID=UPI0023E174A4|nr:renalase-like isoform X2 [Macrosteles quadrilineatus]XP_054287264.1 renalase-like [Macrosteles quadrilineatus]